MVHKARWLAALTPLVFLVLIFWAALRHDPYFWRSPLSLYKSAQDADRRGELPQALRLAEKAWIKAPRNSDVGTFLGRLYLKAGQPEKGLEVLQQVWSRDNKAVAALRGQAQVLVSLGRRRKPSIFWRTCWRNSRTTARFWLLPLSWPASVRKTILWR